MSSMISPASAPVPRSRASWRQPVRPVRLLSSVRAVARCSTLRVRPPRSCAFLSSAAPRSRRQILPPLRSPSSTRRTVFTRKRFSTGSIRRLSWSTRMSSCARRCACSWPEWATRSRPCSRRGPAWPRRNPTPAAALARSAPWLWPNSATARCWPTAPRRSARRKTAKSAPRSNASSRQTLCSPAWVSSPPDWPERTGCTTA